MGKYRQTCLFLAILLSSISVPALAQSPAPYLIKGEVRDISGQTVSGASVCAVPKPASRERLACAPSDADGRFAIRLTRAGKFTVRCLRVLEPDNTRGDPYTHGAEPEVMLTSADPEPFVSVTLPPKNGVLVVKATDGATHLPIEIISTLMCQTDKPGCAGPLARSETGEYRFYAPQSPFTLKIFLHDYEDWSGFGGQATTIEPGTTTNLTVEMQRRPEAIGKALTEAEKQPGLYLPAPVQLAPAEGERFDGFPRKTRLVWDKVEGAVTYEIEVDYCQNGKSPNECLLPAPDVLPYLEGMVPITETTYKFNFVGAQPGRWRVWAVDKDGRAGFKSQWRMFSYSR